MRTVRLNLKDASYNIYIGAGLLKETGRLLMEHGLRKRAVIITDTSVDRLYGSTLEHTLDNCGLAVSRFIIPPGEDKKSLDTVKTLYGSLAEVLTDRTTPVLALGGGVIGDLSGFVAATYMRGVPLVQIPTTLLAQIDSGIGGKVAVDYGNLKNIIGSFYQPKLTIADISLIKSLNKRDISNGLAEIVKHAVILDEKFFDYLEQEIDKIYKLDDSCLDYVVFRSAEIKSKVVTEDEKDTGLRNILNFGHTIGHALETVSDFKLSHGEAVAIGMVAAGKISLKMDMLGNDGLNRLIALLKRAYLPIRLPDLSIESILEVIQHDKKVKNGRLRFVLLKSVGNAVISDVVTADLIRDVLVNWNE